MNNNIYLVLEFDNNYINIPFGDLASVDEFTQIFDNPLELVGALDDYLELGLPREEILDAYLASSLYNINDDSQEFRDRTMAIKYNRDRFDNNDLKIKLVAYLKGNLSRLKELSGMEQILENYRKKKKTNRDISDKEIEAVGAIYLDSSYKRKKECYFKLKDKGIKTKTNEYKIDYRKTTIEELIKDDIMALISLTNMSLNELREYTHRQLASGRTR